VGKRGTKQRVTPDPNPIQDNQKENPKVDHFN